MKKKNTSLFFHYSLHLVDLPLLFAKGLFQVFAALVTLAAVVVVLVLLGRVVLILFLAERLSGLLLLRRGLLLLLHDLLERLLHLLTSLGLYLGKVQSLLLKLDDVAGQLLLLVKQLWGSERERKISQALYFPSFLPLHEFNLKIKLLKM